MWWRDLLSFLGILLALALVLLGSYLVTRWAGTGLGGRTGASGGGHVRVLERVPVSRDQALIVVQAAGRYFLLGSSPSGFSLLAELTEEEGGLWKNPSSGGPPQGEKADFRAILRSFRTKK
ncbi:MAG: flagellar biosynthetic protein FliO [Oscillospiraceae bacterium]|nr:flagellar biosynthetic protein FliO [Oscillospiraceae bacterium]